MTPRSSRAAPRPVPRRSWPTTALTLVLAAALTGCRGAAPGDGGGEADAPPFPPQNRPDVVGTAGAVTSDHPLASAAGYDVLRRGGNAVDAAVTMAAVLSVVRPHMNGVGGDAFALFYDGESGEVTALNASGRAGARGTPAFVREQGHDELPSKGALTVTIPGAVSGWAEALRRRGTLTLAEALEPAIGYADEGFPVTARLHRDLASSGESLNPPGREVYLPGGEAPPVGSILRNPALARTLRTLARDGAGALYGGEVGEALASFVSGRGGHLTSADFRDHEATWVDPLPVDYLGRRVLAMPPNTQGLAQIQQMAMARHFDLRAMGHNTPEYLHTLIELKKLAFADRDRWVADPARAEIPLGALTDSAYLARRASRVAMDSARRTYPPGIDRIPGGGDGPDGGEGPDTDGDGDTVYLTAVDRHGNAVSWIQSLFHAFGSGLMEPETGIVLQNRGALFRLDRRHPNVLAPRKRSFHTLTPLLVLHPDGALAMTLGTPGGDGQTQSLLQIYHNLFLFGMTPQEAVEAPRYRSYDGRRVAIEARVPEGVRRELEARGHELRVIEGWTSTFGGAQMIRVDPESGALWAAAGPRREAYAVAY